MLPGGTETLRQGQSPDFDAVAAYRSVTKWAAQINHVERIPEMMRRAYTYLRTGRGSPVMVQVPRDVGQAELDEASFNYRPVKGYKSAGDPADVADAVKALLAARNPLIYAGQGVLWAEASEELVQFAELVNVPVMTTNTGKSAFPENHPLSVGVGAGTMTRMARHYLDQADLVFGIGCSFTTNLASVGNSPRQGAGPVHRRRKRPEQGRADTPRRYRRRQVGAGPTGGRSQDAGWGQRQTGQRVGGGGNQAHQGRMACPVDAPADVRRGPHQSLPGHLGPDAHRRPDPDRTHS